MDNFKKYLRIYAGGHTGLRRELTAAGLLELRVRIPPGAWMLSLVSVVCCQVQVSATGRSRVQRSPTECSVPGCDQGTSQRRPRLTMATEP